MKNLYNSKKYKDFRNKFLNPDETNRENLLKNIRSVFEVYPLPIDKNSPYLGGDQFNYSFLKKFENIPQLGQDSNQILIAASKIINGGMRFQSPTVMHNINPPVLLESVAISTIANLYNFNLIWDYVSAGVQDAEQQIVRQITKLAGWDTTKSDGVFTYGGKACLTYAIRIGLNRCLKNVASDGINNRHPVVITSKCNHYIIENVCAMLGLGSKSCIRINTDNNEIIDLVHFEKTLNNLLVKKVPIATIILSGGSTINLNIDPVKKAVNIVNKVFKKNNVKYRPFIYFDTVVGWPWMFYKKYDFDKNPFKIDNFVLKRLNRVSSKLSEVKFADGFGADFHKDGFASYNNSAFFVKNGNDLHSILKDEVYLYERKPFGNNFLQHHTIEHSRSTAPVLATWVILQSIGIEGFQMYLAQLTMVGDTFRRILPIYGFEWVNKHSLSYASVFYIHGSGSPRKYSDLINSDSSTLNKVSEYTYGLSQYLSHGGGDPKNAVEVGFLKNLSKSNSGIDISALRVFPMSPHISIEEATTIAHRIGKMKIEYDKISHKQIFCVPEVIHK